MSVNVYYSAHCLIPLTVPFPNPISFYAGKEDVIVSNSCFQMFSTKIKIRVNRKFNVLNIEHSLSGHTIYVFLSSVLEYITVVVFVILWPLLS